MKKLIGAIFALLTATSAIAQDFNLQLKGDGEIYRSLSGVIVISNDACTVPDYQPVVLHFYNNPANSTVGPFWDNFTYSIEEPVIIINDAGDPEISYQNVVHTCDVFGTAYLNDTGPNAVVYNSRSSYDGISKRLVLRNTELWEGMENTGTVFNYVEMHFDGNVFILDEVIKDPPTN